MARNPMRTDLNLDYPSPLAVAFQIRCLYPHIVGPVSAGMLVDGEDIDEEEHLLRVRPSQMAGNRVHEELEAVGPCMADVESGPAYLLFMDQLWMVRVAA